MPWYATGTASFTNGSATVTGTGTSWIAGAARGEGVVAPDGRIYEITNIASDTSLTIAPAYLGATQSGATYRIIPSQSYIRELAAEVAALVASYASVVNTAGAGAFGDGTVTEPGLRFVSDPNTGIRRTGADAMAVVANGVDQLTLNTSGLTVADNKLTITDNTDATKKAVFEASGITTGTTRTFTLPNASTTLVGTDVTQTLTGKTLTSPVISGGTLDNAVIGGTTRAAGNFTTLDANGNVILGDAATDTVRVNGTIGVGGPAQTTAGVYVLNTALTGASQFGVRSDVVGTTASTTAVIGLAGSPGTVAATWTAANTIALRALNAVKGAGSTITSQHGVYIDDQTQGVSNFGVTSLVSSGTNKWNIYASGTAANYFAGNVQFAAGTAALPSITRFSDENTGLLFPAADTVAVSTAGVERMRIDASGNVGIGIASPVGRLDVAGTAPTLNIRDTQQKTWAIGDAVGTLDFYADDTSGVGAQAVSRIRSLSDASSAAPSGALAFWTAVAANAAAERMRLTSAGNLGIANTAPTERLDVTGNIKASGSVTSATVVATASVAAPAITEAASPVVTQVDVGTDPNQAPLSGMLGRMAFQNPEGVVLRPQASMEPSGIGEMVFQLTSNTSLVIKVKGSDGTVRSSTLTLA